MSVSHVCVTGGFFSGEGTSTLVPATDKRAKHWHCFVYAQPGDAKVPSGGWVIAEGWLGKREAAESEADDFIAGYRCIKVIPEIAEGTTFTAAQGMALKPVSLPNP